MSEKKTTKTDIDKLGRMVRSAVQMTKYYLEQGDVRKAMEWAERCKKLADAYELSVTSYYYEV